MNGWNRPEFKRQAKICMRRYYWTAVLACVIVLLLQFSGTAGTNNGAGSEDEPAARWSYSDGNTVFDADSSEIPFLDEYLDRFIYAQNGKGVFYGIINSGVGMLLIAIILIRLALSLLIINPIRVGLSSFFYRNRTVKTGIGELAFAFNRKDFWPVVKAMLRREISIILWSLLLVVPGIIKAYEYSMVEYILAENPSMSSKEVLDLSRQMTAGHKGDLFVLDLSFFGWFLLGQFTLGLSDIFYTNPYRYATSAEAYAFLKNRIRTEASQDAAF